MKNKKIKIQSRYKNGQLFRFFVAVIFCLLWQNSRGALQEPITGTVIDESGLPLPGVTIQIKNTNVGTTTNMNGEFSLQAENNDILVISFLGYTSQEIPVDGREVIDITLNEDVGELDEVLVVGYGTVKKSDLTGSVSSINTDDFEKGAQTSTLNLLQGKAAGVQITQADARPGGGFSVRIRGANSITAGNEPLYVIDGLPGAPANALNPGDIESVEILKDASATAIYGSRGANGVVIITTKKGKSGELTVNYDGYIGTQEVAHRLDMMNAQEYTSFLNGIQSDQGLDPLFSSQEIDAAGVGTDWQEEIFRTAPVQNHQLSLSGGSDNTSYYVSLNRFEQDGVVINSGFKRTSGRVNISHSVDKFNFGLNLNTSLVEENIIVTGGINATAGVIPSALQMDPLMPVFDESGAYSESTSLDLDNPVALARTIFNESETNRTFGSIFAEYFVLDKLSAKINLGSDRGITRSDFYVDKTTKRGQSSNGSADINSQENVSNLLELTLNYNNTFNEDHQINAVAGYTYQDFIGRGFNAGSQNFPTDAFLTDNLAAGEQERYTVGSGKGKNQLLSYLGRVNYSWRDKYLVTASFRIDGSSRFGEDKKYGYFPSLALGWKLDQESFLEDFESLSSLKLRGSYGITGNQEIGNYNSLVLLGTVRNAVFNDQEFSGISPIQLANPDLKWETTSQFNIGLDFGFFKNRLVGSFDYFHKKTSDLLLNLPIPATTGFTSSLQNVGDTQNSGFEMMIDTRNLVGDFVWSTNLNLSTVKNEVTNLGEIPFILQGDERFLNDFTILQVGESINSYYGYQVDGIFQSQEDIGESAQPNASPGDLRFADVNNDGVINSEDRVILGNPFPDVTLGLTNTFEYKGFNLSVFLQGSLGNDMLNFTKIDSENPISARRNRQTYVLDRWTPDNPTNENPSFINQNVSRAINSRVVEDASYLRLQNLSIGYNFPGLKWNSIKNFSLYATGQNLFTITDYSGFNPDVNVRGTSNIRLDYNAYPLPKIFTVGVQIGF